MTTRFAIDAGTLASLYATSSAKEIGSMYGVSESTIRRRLKEYGIRKEYAEDIVEYYDDSNIMDDLDLLDEYQAVKDEIIAGFERWGDENLKGAPLSTAILSDYLEASDLQLQDDGEYQLNTENYTVGNAGKKPIVKVIYDQRQKKLTIIMRDSNSYNA
jgi:hypothetical protein